MVCSRNDEDGPPMLGGVEMTLYLGHIFSTRLNFQTSMWQLVMTEVIYLPTIMREQLCWETGTLRLFSEVIPSLPSLPDSSQAPVNARRLITMTPMQTIPMGGTSKQSTPLNGRQRLQSRVSPKCHVQQLLSSVGVKELIKQWGV